MPATGLVERLQKDEQPELRVVVVVPAIVLLEQWRALPAAGEAI